ncbi:MAG: hypothetical protein MOB07_31570 [Acidobacteria bacterium]|nr:hypothetical protein [Acidobacteriota bacterium]
MKSDEQAKTETLNLTPRDLLVIHLLAFLNDKPGETPTTLVELMYAIADAMLEVRERAPGEIVWPEGIDPDTHNRHIGQ